MGFGCSYSTPTLHWAKLEDKTKYIVKLADAGAAAADIRGANGG